MGCQVVLRTRRAWRTDNGSVAQWVLCTLAKILYTEKHEIKDNVMKENSCTDSQGGKSVYSTALYFRVDSKMLGC